MKFYFYHFSHSTNKRVFEFAIASPLTIAVFPIAHYSTTITTLRRCDGKLMAGENKTNKLLAPLHDAIK